MLCGPSGAVKARRVLVAQQGSDLRETRYGGWKISRHRSEGSRGVHCSCAPMDLVPALATGGGRGATRCAAPVPPAFSKLSGWLGSCRLGNGRARLVGAAIRSAQDFPRPSGGDVCAHHDRSFPILKKPRVHWALDVARRPRADVEHAMGITLHAVRAASHAFSCCTEGRSMLGTALSGSLSFLSSIGTTLDMTGHADCITSRSSTL